MQIFHTNKHMNWIFFLKIQLRYILAFINHQPKNTLGSFSRYTPRSKKKNWVLWWITLWFVGKIYKKLNKITTGFLHIFFFIVKFSICVISVWKNHINDWKIWIIYEGNIIFNNWFVFPKNRWFVFFTYTSIQ